LDADELQKAKRLMSKETRQVAALGVNRMNVIGKAISKRSG
jgi:hypothetical protein